MFNVQKCMYFKQMESEGGGGVISVNTHVSLFFPQQVCAMQFFPLICQGITLIKESQFHIHMGN